VAAIAGGVLVSSLTTASNKLSGPPPSTHEQGVLNDNSGLNTQEEGGGDDR
jgi:hypothetical protein